MPMNFNKDRVNLDRYRDLLHFHASLKLDPALRGKVDLSGVIQETLLEAHRGYPQLAERGDQNLLPWLKQILARNLVDEVRRVKCSKNDVTRERSLDDSHNRLEAWLMADDTSPSERAGRAEQQLRLVAAIQELPPDQQHVVVRHHLEGASLAELADEMHRSPEAVAGLLYRGLTKLRGMLTE